jgi:hypothetical protein
MNSSTLPFIGVGRLTFHFIPLENDHCQGPTLNLPTDFLLFSYSNHPWRLVSLNPLPGFPGPRVVPVPWEANRCSLRWPCLIDARSGTWSICVMVHGYGLWFMVFRVFRVWLVVYEPTNIPGMHHPVALSENTVDGCEVLHQLIDALSRWSHDL